MYDIYLARRYPFAITQYDTRAPWHLYHTNALACRTEKQAERIVKIFNENKYKLEHQFMAWKVFEPTSITFDYLTDEVYINRAGCIRKRAMTWED